MIEQMLLIAKANNIDNLNEDEITNIKHGIAQTFYELIEENKKIPQNRMKEILLTLTKIIAKEQGLNVSVGFRATSAVEMENKSSIPLAPLFALTFLKASFKLFRSSIFVIISSFIACLLPFFSLSCNTIFWITHLRYT